jgi:hypothetical protein
MATTVSARPFARSNATPAQSGCARVGAAGAGLHQFLAGPFNMTLNVVSKRIKVLEVSGLLRKSKGDAEAGACVGGRFRLRIAGAESACDVAGVYREVESHTRLVFTWRPQTMWRRDRPEHLRQKQN